MNCERVSFCRRIAHGIYRGISVKNDANARLGGGEFIGKKILHSRVREMEKREKENGERERVKDEEVILYLLWHDHRPLRIVNVGDCEYHRLWDIGGWEEDHASEKIPR